MATRIEDIQRQGAEPGHPDNVPMALVNQYINDSLKGVDIVKRDDSGNATPWEFDFDHPLINARWQLWAKQMFVQRCGGWRDNKQTLMGRESTVKSYYSILMRIGVWATQYKPDSFLSLWEEKDIAQLLRDTTLNAIPWTKKRDIVPLGRSAAIQMLEMLETSKRLHDAEIISDGMAVRLPRNFIEDALTPTLTSQGVSYSEWIKGNSWESIPLVLAMTMLQRAIETLRAPYTKFLVEFMPLQRDRGFRVGPLKTGVGFSNYLAGDTKQMQGQSFKCIENYRQIKALLDKHISDNGQYFSVNQKDIHHQCDAVYDACIVIWLTLTGIRLSELISISGDDYDQNPDGTWVFKSNIIKNRQGVAEARALSGLTLEAAEALCALSYVKKRHNQDGLKSPLFGRCFTQNDENKKPNERNMSRCTSERLIREVLKHQLNNTLVAHPELKTLCEHIHPHMFRHTWAEFALRRFEGNVLEAIRRHFLHAYGSYWTTTYTFNKLNKEVQNMLERRYLQEILERITTENVEAMKDPDFKRDMTGKIVSYLSRSMDVNIVKTSDIKAFIESIEGEFESIVAHEYGYCIVGKATRHLSKCYDRKTQTPLIENGCFELCSDCLHNAVSTNSSKEFIVRTAISHESMIAAQEKLWGKNVKSKAVDASRRVVKQAEKILDEMEV